MADNWTKRLLVFRFNPKEFSKPPVENSYLKFIKEYFGKGSFDKSGNGFRSIDRPNIYLGDEKDFIYFAEVHERGYQIHNQFYVRKGSEESAEAGRLAIKICGLRDYKYWEKV
jgi:hypothetical protein